MVHFFPTDGEYQACDFLVAYFMDHNGFYIVIKSDLKQARSGKRTRWRFTLTMNKQGEQTVVTPTRALQRIEMPGTPSIPTLRARQSEVPIFES